MCGIAGLIHRGKSSDVGRELQDMLQALKHRGPDSTGYALYAENDGQNFIMRFKVGENVGEGSNSVNEDESIYDERKKLVDKKLSDLGAIIVKEESEVYVHFWEDLGAIAPTIGILGAVLGLIHVMENLDKPEMIGPGIAIAFVATLYGVGFANLFFIPMGKKLKRKAILDSQAREMVIIGIEGILSGLNPKVIQEKLKVFTGGSGEEG